MDEGAPSGWRSETVVGESLNAAFIENSFERCEFVSSYRMQAVPAIFYFFRLLLEHLHTLLCNT